VVALAVAMKMRPKLNADANRSREVELATDPQASDRGDQKAAAAREQQPFAGVGLWLAPVAVECVAH
jgi:hypothetical protein